MISAASSTNPSTRACSTARPSSRKETGIEFRDLEIQNEAQREQVLRKFAKDGFSPIMTAGLRLGDRAEEGRRRNSRRPSSASSTMSSTCRTSSRSCSRRGGLVPGRRHRGETSKTGKVGFVGGMDIPLISNFGCGYAQGVKYAQTARTRSLRQHDRHDAARPGTIRSRAANSPSRRSIAAPTSSTPPPARPVRAC